MRAPPAGSGTLQAGARALEDRVFDLGLMLTSQAIRRQLAAMPHELYLIRLIHGLTKRPFPGERLWTADQLMNLATIRFLRARNREGCDIYVHPYAQNHNAGYILVDLDWAEPTVVAAMCAQGHEPCVVLQTSPGHLQAWVHVSSAPLPPDIATAVGKHLALTYSGDRASTDWRHLGRLAGFTNQKPQRRTRDGCAPWVKVVYTHPGLARHADELLQSAAASVSEFAQSAHLGLCPGACSQSDAASAITAAQATVIYQTWMHRWQIAQRFAPPDWSIVDLWVARALLAQGWPPDQVRIIIQLGSPHFPRRHTHPDDYLRRTLARAFSFPSPGPAVCVAHDRTPAAARANRARSNSAGGQ